MSGLTLLSMIPIVVAAMAGTSTLDRISSDLSMAMGNMPGQPGVSPFGATPGAMIPDLGHLITTLTILFSILTVVAAVHLFVVGWQMRQRQWWTFCYLTGWGECIMFPFGTILGIFTIIVLARPSVKRLFGVR